MHSLACHHMIYRYANKKVHHILPYNLLEKEFARSYQHVKLTDTIRIACDCSSDEFIIEDHVSAKVARRVVEKTQEKIFRKIIAK